jgi:hypothetical protein
LVVDFMFLLLFFFFFIAVFAWEQTVLCTINQ